MKKTTIHIPKIKSGFATPEAYFDGFEQRLFAKMNLEKPVRVIPFYQKRPVWMSSIAAVFVLSLLLTIFYKQNSTQVSADELTTYLIENQSVSTNDMLQYLDETDLESLEQTSTETSLAAEEYLRTTENLEHSLVE
jgi:hypothetical protein